MRTPISIDLCAIGRGSVMVDGKDLANCIRKIEVTAEVGELTQVTLHLVNTTLRLAAPADVQAVVAALPTRGQIEDGTTFRDTTRRWRWRNVPDVHA